MCNRELFERFPESRSIPHLDFATLPTPVDGMPELAERLNLGSLQVKRDDLSGSLYGGNKVRKLEFLLADARARGFDEVWTVGGSGSHHCLATCIWSREVGLDCGVLHFPQPTTPHVQKNIKALSTTRPKVHLISTEPGLSGDVFGSRLRAWRAEHDDIYYIPGGGSSGVGALGYVNAALEFVAQVEAGIAERPEVIVVAAGTCGTLAGLLLGFAMAEFAVEVIGVRVVDDWIAAPHTVERLANAAAAILREAGVVAADLDPACIRLEHDFFGPDYGVPTPEGLAARDMMAAAGGVTLEPTYTAKAFAAIAGRPDLRGRDVLYWHTLNGADLSGRVAQADLDALPELYRGWACDPPDWEDG